MVKIVLVSVGSRGDIQPYCILGQALAARGHDVMIATEQRLESLVVDEFKLPFRRIVGDICSGFFDPEHQRRLRAAKFFEALEIVSNWNSEFDPRAILNSYEAAVREADVVVSGVMSVTETYCLAEKYNVPWIPIFLGTVVLPTSAYPHWIFEDLMPSFLGCCLNRMTYSIIFRKMWQKQQVYINPWRVEVLKLPPIKESMGLLGKLTDSKSITVYQACSLLLASPTRALPHDYPPGKVDYVGYLFPSAESATVSPTLQAFLSASPDVPVIYIGFGSMPTLDPDQLFQLVVDLCRKANCRAVLVSGWSSLADMPSSDLVCVESSAPHAWLFPKMKCLIHHCGIGTTGAALRSGVPQIPCPILYDQFHNAKKMVALGVALSQVLPKEMTSDRLAADIKAVLRNDSHVQDKAKQYGAYVENESLNSVAKLCDAIEAAKPF
ncbi:hypothetical protein LEN26_002242 [Aphanomyces euteiches]|nr:hypothetical protein LEN26_015510 [Aphanomyces euteiches]KAH9121817.1 hypothetical protein AeMF1_006626 [Aphanomyces euteiches]KAH9159625.1 hypothetical protein LEN26_002242 [Aphanomyces euteiches]